MVPSLHFRLFVFVNFSKCKTSVVLWGFPMNQILSVVFSVFTKEDALHTNLYFTHIDNSLQVVSSAGGIVSKETVCCVGGKVKH